MMGDVFDRIVSRAVVAPDRSPPAGLTTWRGPVFDVPDESRVGVENRASGSMEAELREVEVERGAGEGDHDVPQTRTVGPTFPPKPHVGGRGTDHEPEPDRGRRLQAARPTYEPASDPPALGADHRESHPDGPRPARLDLSPQPATRGAPGRGPERSASEVAAADVTGSAPGPAPGEPPADAVTARPDVAIGVEASEDHTPDARPARTDLRARPRPPRPDPMAATPSTRAVPAEELLREHLAPALVDRGALRTEDAARLTAVGLDPIVMPAGGDVHVHFGHVVVQQAPTPPAPQAPRAGNRDADRPDRIDHADYLARQRRRWS